MFRSRYNDWMDPFEIFSEDIYNYDGSINRSGFAPVSQAALRKQDSAQQLFLKHLATVDTSNGAVTAEIIQFHLVGDMRKKFNKFVKDHGCTTRERKLTREEQDKVNKNRKSLMVYTSVTVTPEAQQAYFAKNPSKGPTATTASTSATPLMEGLKRKRDANHAQLDEPSTSGSDSKKAKK